MLKELKYLFYILVIFLFTFFVIKFYFSDKNKKNYFRSINSLNEKINNYSLNLPILKNDTDNIIEYVDNKKSKNKKKYHFWKLLEND
tara:strand:+ start:2267 stop:2527 length:261 start_codon:yes stop_codon:yes gene_type:complete